MPFTLDTNGYLVDDKGQRTKIGDSEVQLTGVVTQQVFDQKVKERLARQDEQHRKANEELIKEWEGKLKGTTSPQEAEDLKKKINDLESKVLSADEISAKRLKENEAMSQAEVKKAKTEAERNLNMYKNERFRTGILSEAGRLGFLDPEDAVTQLAPYINWEEKTNEAGKPTGEIELTFKIGVVEKTGEQPVAKKLTAAQAVENLAGTKKYLIRAQGSRGYGGQAGTPGAGGTPGQAMKDAPARTRMAGGYTK